MRTRGAQQRSTLGWTPEPSYEKPDISVEAMGLYYRIVAPLMLPWVQRRLLNLLRCTDNKCFFQRNRAHPPSGNLLNGPEIRSEAVKQKNGHTEDYLYVADVEGIAACADASAVEFHGWGSRAGSVERPDRMVIDLDPGQGVTFEDVKQAALKVRQGFGTVGLECFAMLTGGKGIHVVVPLSAEAEWPRVRAFAKTFCTVLAQAEPRRFTVELPKEKRAGRIFLDYLRNQRTATAILPYSARARDGSPVAAPVDWEELEEVDRSDLFSIGDVEELLRRSKQRQLKRWGLAEQALPML